MVSRRTTGALRIHVVWPTHAIAQHRGEDLARKPGALRNGAPFKDWPLPEALDQVQPRSPTSARAPSATSWASPSCRWPRNSPTSCSTARRSTSRWSGSWRAAASWRASATSCSSVEPGLLHTAHLAMSLKFQLFLQRIAGRRTPQAPCGSRALDGVCLEVAGPDHPGRSLAELMCCKLAVLNETTHARWTD